MSATNVTGVHTSKVVPRRWLVIHHFRFSCPYCGKQWERGGSKEGFVKSGAENHVMGCYEVALFLRGYWSEGYPLVAPVDHRDAGECRRLKALTARRKRSPEWGRLEADYSPPTEPSPVAGEEVTDGH